MKIIELGGSGAPRCEEDQNGQSKAFRSGIQNRADQASRLTL
jgi:hypothetical protein